VLMNTEMLHDLLELRRLVTVNHISKKVIKDLCKQFYSERQWAFNNSTLLGSTTIPLDDLS